MAPPPAVPWKIVVVAAGLFLMNLVLAVSAPGILVPQDWWGYEQLPERIAAGTVYEHEVGYWWVWPPIATALFAWVVVPLGYPVWFGLHFAVLPFLRSWGLIAVTILSLPFWIDVVVGHTTVFVAVAGVAALRGSRSGAVASIALFSLAPRPLQVPLMAWLLWKRPDTHVPFAAIAVVTITITLASGQTDEMLGAIAAIQPQQMALEVNFSLTRWIGPAWFIISIPLAAWLTYKGRVGLAGLALTPYTLPSYWLVLLWELIRRPADGHVERGTGRRPTPGSEGTAAPGRD